ncbi:MAG TPA: acyltransferase family protein [Rhizomicrobium sp.]|nr:acyltransferase family protein [Rhizomicrobium sp.]
MAITGAASDALTTEAVTFDAAKASVRSPARVKYRADVDGLRAVAVLSVLLFHAHLAAFTGGYVGVDVFFVISGFVITTKLVEEIDEGKFSIANFYVRRIRRILPALVAVILASTIAALVFFLPDALEDFAKSVIATATFVSNAYFWKNSGYFETAALDRPLLHTWSLAIEEQFYILIPIALYLLVTRARRWAFWVFAATALLSLALSIFATDRAPTANFFLLPTRAWELLLGVLVALSPFAPPRNVIVREIIAGASLCLIGFAVLAYNSATPFPGLSALAPTLGTAALIFLGTQGTPTFAATGLAIRPMVGIGLISYSLYLVHWPILVFARYALLRDLQGWEIAAVLGASMVLAWLSYRYVETPFRRPARPATRMKLFSATATVLVALCAIGFVGTLTKGAAFLHPAFAGEMAASKGPDLWLSNKCFLQDQKATDWAGDICVRTEGAGRNAVLWGDSFAAQYVDGLMANQKNLTRNIVQYTFAGCPPILSYRSYARPGCADFNARIFDIVKRYQADTVVMATRWDQMRERGLGGLPDTIAQLRARGLKVFVIGQSPLFAFNVQVLDFRDAGAGGNGTADWYTVIAPNQNRDIRAASTGATFIDPLPAFCRGDRCEYKTPRGLLFADYGHFSALGSDRAVKAYFPLYRRDDVRSSAN